MEVTQLYYLVDSPERRHINSLPPNGTSTPNTSGVLTGSGVDDGVNQDLERVLPSQQVDDLEAVLHNPHGQQFLAVVSAVHHDAKISIVRRGNYASSN